MPGTVIEILSTRKLIFFFVILLVFQVVFFLIGGLIAPQPSVANENIMTNCEDMEAHDPPKVFLPDTCFHIDDLSGPDARRLDPKQIVLAVVIPPKSYAMIPWFQYLLALLDVKITFQLEHQHIPNSTMFLDVMIYYSNHDNARIIEDAWDILAGCKEERTLHCEFRHSMDEDHEGYEYDCEILHLFQLGAVSHKYYLINIRLPIDVEADVREEAIVHNRDIGNVQELSVISIRQTGGFTKVWTSLKSVMTFIMAFPLVWFWRRIMILDRKPLLIEKAIFSLGISMLFLNLPLEFISIFFDAPWMLFFIDVRQGFFYAILLSFWIIFTGEHLMDQLKRNKLSNYRCQLGTIFGAMLALLAFDIAERGMQLVNPCTTVWKHPNFAITLIAIASIFGCIYFLMLCFLVFKVFRAISYKRRFVLTPERNLRFQNIVFRFRLLMLLSVATAGLTVVFYILSQKYDGLLHYGDHKVQVNSAFFTGVYGLWNIYVFLVLSVYAPSHKQFDADENDDQNSRHELIALNSTERVDTQITEQTQILELTQQKEAQS